MASQLFKNHEDLLDLNYEFRLGKYLGRGWNIFEANRKVFIIYTVIVYFLVFGIPTLINLYAMEAEGLYIGLDLPLGNIFSQILFGPFLAGFFLAAFKVIQKKPIKFRDFFYGFIHFWPLFLTSLIANSLIGIGFSIFIVPGVYLTVSYLFGMPLVIERKLKPWQALEISRRLIAKQWSAFFQFWLFLFLLNLIALFVLSVGLLFTVPWSLCSIAVAYEDIIGFLEPRANP
ncbi:hypothetical protein VZH09_11845 [Synechococcus elongatus IITB7]|uniref:hypothetical protein n=1 Tax=Synechococcus elongatus TaxID=32046 RepID=UPI0030D5C8CD